MLFFSKVRVFFFLGEYCTCYASRGIRAGERILSGRHPVRHDALQFYIFSTHITVKPAHYNRVCGPTLEMFLLASSYCLYTIFISSCLFFLIFVLLIFIFGLPFNFDMSDENKPNDVETGAGGAAETMRRNGDIEDGEFVLHPVGQSSTIVRQKTHFSAFSDARRCSEMFSDGRNKQFFDHRGSRRDTEIRPWERRCNTLKLCCHDYITSVGPSDMPFVRHDHGLDYLHNWR